MKHTLPTLCILLLAAMTARANGDPVAVHSALTLSPTPVAVHVPEVQLVDEVVSFVPRDRYMEVTVRYLLHNRSSRNFDKLPYGFPIDYIGTGKARWEDRDYVSESQQEKGWSDSYIRNVNYTSYSRGRDTRSTSARRSRLRTLPAPLHRLLLFPLRSIGKWFLLRPFSRADWTPL